MHAAKSFVSVALCNAKSFGYDSAAQALLICATHLLQAAAPPTRVVAAVRGLVGPLLRPQQHVMALYERLQRLFFLAEGQDMGRCVDEYRCSALPQAQIVRPLTPTAGLNTALTQRCIGF